MNLLGGLWSPVIASAARYQESALAVLDLIRSVYRQEVTSEQLYKALIGLDLDPHSLYHQLSAGYETPQLNALAEALGLPEKSLCSFPPPLQSYACLVLRSAGIQPTDELVTQICVAAEQGSIVTGDHPYIIVDALVDVLRAYPPPKQPIQDFGQAMQQLINQAGESAASLDGISQGILRMASETPQPAKPKQKAPYYQKDKQQWWKGKRS